MPRTIARWPSSSCIVPMKDRSIFSVSPTKD